MLKKCLVITGPTATGKTDVGLCIAKQYNGELISCDSRQIYKGFDLISGKYPSLYQQIEKHHGLWIVDGIKIWMYDLVNAQATFNVYDFCLQTEATIARIIAQGKLPIIVGGTGLYLRLLMDGISTQVSQDPNLRTELENLSTQTLQQNLQSTSLETWQKLSASDRQNRRRLIRRLELLSRSDKIRQPAFEGIGSKLDIFKIGLTAPQKVLYTQVERRVDNRLETGMLEQGERDFHSQKLSLARLKDLGLEYAFLAEFIEGKTKELIRDRLKQKVRNFVKRQLTWFKKEPDIRWFNITDSSFWADLEKAVQEWYHTR